MFAIAERFDLIAQRPLADERQLGAERTGELAERLDHHVGLLLAIEPADVDQQRLAVGEAQLAPQPRVAPARTELAELDSQRHDLDVVDSEASKLCRSAVAAQREHGIEAPVERSAIGIADPAERSADRPAEHLRQWPLDIDRRKIGHISGDERRFRPALAVPDRRPREIVRILALDHVGPEALQRRPHRAVAQQQPVMPASGHVRRGDGDRGRPLLGDHFVASAGDDHQMAVRSRFEDVPPFVQQIGAHPAADVRPALRQVAEQLRPAAAVTVWVVPAH